MSWATDYAIEHIVENDEADAVKIDGSSIHLSMKNKPDVDAYIRSTLTTTSYQKRRLIAAVLLDE